MAKNIVGLNDNNVLSMDYVVNSKGTKLIDVIYSVGSIYMSFNSTSPATLFGGTWVQITDRFLYCANSSGTTGGENSHTLTVSEMPSHTHNISEFNDISHWSTGTTFDVWDGTNHFYSANGERHYPTDWLGASGSEGRVSTQVQIYPTYTGGSQPHNNMPQYITCYAWHRTA